MKQYKRVFTKQFRKDARHLQKMGIDMSKLQKTIDLLCQEKQLPDSYRDHELKGQMKGIRECHIGPDWLLCYTKDNEKLVLLLLCTGSHRDVFGIE